MQKQVQGRLRLLSGLAHTALTKSFPHADESQLGWTRKQIGVKHEKTAQPTVAQVGGREESGRGFELSWLPFRSRRPKYNHDAFTGT